jgi:hypothetical protein
MKVAWAENRQPIPFPHLAPQVLRLSRQWPDIIYLSSRFCHHDKRKISLWGNSCIDINLYDSRSFYLIVIVICRLRNIRLRQVNLKSSFLITHVTVVNRCHARRHGRIVAAAAIATQTPRSHAHASPRRDRQHAHRALGQRAAAPGPRSILDPVRDPLGLLRPAAACCGLLRHGKGGP